MNVRKRKKNSKADFHSTTDHAIVQSMKLLAHFDPLKVEYICVDIEL